MSGVRYTLRLREPVLANNLAGDTNSAQSLTFVPGGLVRGALIAAYLRDREDSDMAADPEFRRLFLSGATRYLHAYPVHNTHRALPTPLSWKTTKREASADNGKAYNLAVAEPDFDDLKNLKGRLGYLGGQTFTPADESWVINVHTQRDAERGRSTEDAGAVFRYEALPAGLVVSGIILTDSDADRDKLKAWLQQEDLFLGKARTAGYGLVAVEAVADLPRSWREGWEWELSFSDDDRYGEEEPEYEEIEHMYSFTATCLSAVIVRDDNGQVTLDILPALSTALGVPLSTLQTSAVFRISEVVGGFNRKWGLPLPQMQALGAGSVFVIDSNDPVTVDALRQLERRGLGERREEGFGRIAVDLEQAESLRWLTQPDTATTMRRQTVELDEASQTMGEQLLKRLLRQELDERILQLVGDYRHAIKKHKTRVSNSQAARWRTFLRDVLSQTTKETLSDQKMRVSDFYAAEEKKRSAAWEGMRRARVGKAGESEQRLTAWIAKVSEDAQEPWSILGYGNVPPSRTVGRRQNEAGITEPILAVVADEQMRFEYRLRLIDAVLEAFTREDKA